MTTQSSSRRSSFYPKNLLHVGCPFHSSSSLRQYWCFLWHADRLAKCHTLLLQCVCVCAFFRHYTWTSMQQQQPPTSFYSCRRCCTHTRETWELAWIVNCRAKTFFSAPTNCYTHLLADQQRPSKQHRFTLKLFKIFSLSCARFMYTKAKWK